MPDAFSSFLVNGRPTEEIENVGRLYENKGVVRTPEMRMAMRRKAKGNCLNSVREFFFTKGL